MRIHKPFTSEDLPKKFRSLSGWGILAVFFLLYGMNCQAGSEAWIMSIPTAISEEQIYKVRIEGIDGVATKPSRRYRISAGQHAITLILMLNVEWDPNLADGERTDYRKEMVLEVEAGSTYQVGAKLNPDAPLDSQLDGSYWKPILHRKFKPGSE
jgi:hypothetical protein